MVAIARCACGPFLIGFAMLGAAPAQSPWVAPASHASREGSGTTNLPFGRSTAVRVQCAYDRRLFAQPVTISALALRLDGGATAAAKQVDAELRLSTAATPLLGIGPSFAANRGLDEVVVVPRQLWSLPAQALGSTPNPFLPAVPFAVPFAYDPARGPLLVEFVVHGQPPGAYALDITYVCDSAEVAVGPPSCPVPGSGPLQVASAATQVMWGRPWTAQVLGAPPFALTTLALGTTDSGVWQGFALPADLGALGAPGCVLAIDLAASLFAAAGGDGSAAYQFTIPNDPGLVGYWIRFQGGALVPAANQLGLVTSQGRKVEVCGFEPVARVWAAGLTATSGALEIGVAPVVQFTVQ
jgi:hypothetical protein